MNAASVINRLLRTATDLGSAAVDDVYGHGIVNAAAAVGVTMPDVAANPLGDRGSPRPPTGRHRGWSLTAVPVAVVVVGVLMNVGIVTVVILCRRRRSRTA